MQGPLSDPAKYPQKIPPFFPQRWDTRKLSSSLGQNFSSLLANVSLSEIVCKTHLSSYVSSRIPSISFPSFIYPKYFHPPLLGPVKVNFRTLFSDHFFESDRGGLPLAIYLLYPLFFISLRFTNSLTPKLCKSPIPSSDQVIRRLSTDKHTIVSISSTFSEESISCRPFAFTGETLSAAMEHSTFLRVRPNWIEISLFQFSFMQFLSLEQDWQYMIWRLIQ